MLYFTKLTGVLLPEIVSKWHFRSKDVISCSITVIINQSYRVGQKNRHPVKQY